MYPIQDAAAMWRASGGRGKVYTRHQRFYLVDCGTHVALVTSGEDKTIFPNGSAADRACVWQDHLGQDREFVLAEYADMSHARLALEHVQAYFRDIGLGGSAVPRPCVVRLLDVIRPTFEAMRYPRTIDGQKRLWIEADDFFDRSVDPVVLPDDCKSIYKDMSVDDVLAAYQASLA